MNVLLDKHSPAFKEDVASDKLSQIYVEYIQVIEKILEETNSGLTAQEFTEQIFPKISQIERIDSRNEVKALFQWNDFILLFKSRLKIPTKVYSHKTEPPKPIPQSMLLVDIPPPTKKNR